MNARRPSPRSILTLALGVVLALCDPNSPITKSAEMGVWFLLAVILLVEGGFGVFFLFYLRRRARGFHDPMPRPVLRVVKKGI
jgi:hypothetical protein